VSIFIIYQVKTRGSNSGKRADKNLSRAWKNTQMPFVPVSTTSQKTRKLKRGKDARKQVVLFVERQQTYTVKNHCNCVPNDVFLFV
jgi:hypothetical protein